MDSPPAPSSDLLTRKYGPLPTWGWMAVGTGALYLYRKYKANKAGAATAVSTTPSAGYTSANLPSNIQPQNTTVNENAYNGNLTTIGRQINSGNATGVQMNAPLGGVPTVVIAPPPVTPPPTVTPTPATTPVAAPPPPQGRYLTVVRWNPAQRNAPSTLSGLALQAYGNASLWPKIWNAPQNAALVARRGDPTKIQPGDSFFAPQ